MDSSRIVERSEVERGKGVVEVRITQNLKNQLIKYNLYLPFQSNIVCSGFYEVFVKINWYEKRYCREGDRCMTDTERRGSQS